MYPKTRHFAIGKLEIRRLDNGASIHRTSEPVQRVMRAEGSQNNVVTVDYQDPRRASEIIPIADDRPATSLTRNVSSITPIAGAPEPVHIINYERVADANATRAELRWGLEGGRVVALPDQVANYALSPFHDIPTLIVDYVSEPTELYSLVDGKRIAVLGGNVARLMSSYDSRAPFFYAELFESASIPTGDTPPSRPKPGPVWAIFSLIDGSRWSDDDPIVRGQPGWFNDPVGSLVIFSRVSGRPVDPSSGGGGLPPPGSPDFQTTPALQLKDGNFVPLRVKVWGFAKQVPQVTETLLIQHLDSDVPGALYVLEGGAQRTQLSGVVEQVWPISPTSRLMLADYANRPAELRNSATGELVGQPLPARVLEVQNGCLMTSPMFLVRYEDNHAAELRSCVDGAFIAEVAGDQPTAFFSPGSAWDAFVVSYADRSEVWSSETGRMLATLTNVPITKVWYRAGGSPHPAIVVSHADGAAPGGVIYWLESKKRLELVDTPTDVSQSPSGIYLLIRYAPTPPRWPGAMTNEPSPEIRDGATGDVLSMLEGGLTSVSFDESGQAVQVKYGDVRAYLIDLEFQKRLRSASTLADAVNLLKCPQTAPFKSAPGLPLLVEAEVRETNIWFDRECEKVSWWHFWFDPWNWSSWWWLANIIGLLAFVFQRTDRALKPSVQPARQLNIVGMITTVVGGPVRGLGVVLVTAVLMRLYGGTSAAPVIILIGKQKNLFIPRTASGRLKETTDREQGHG